MVMLTRKRLLAAAIETTPGTAETLIAADIGFPVFDASIQYESSFNDRENSSSFSALASVPGPNAGSLTFTIEPWAAAAATSVPLWASTLLPACGWVAGAGGLFAPKTEPPGANVKTLTIGLYEDGQLKQLRGAAGTMVFTMAAGQIVRAEVTMTGVWDDPVAATFPTILGTFEPGTPQRFANATIGVSGMTTPVQEISIDLGNDVQLGEDITNISAHSFARIVGRRVVGKINPESITAATRFSNLTNGVAGTLNVSIGANPFVFDAPNMQLTNVQESERNGVVADDIDFQLNASSDAGDDELTIDTEA